MSITLRYVAVFATVLGPVVLFEVVILFSVLTIFDVVTLFGGTSSSSKFATVLKVCSTSRSMLSKFHNVY